MVFKHAREKNLDSKLISLYIK